jgi:hypothetical protein
LTFAVPEYYFICIDERYDGHGRVYPRAFAEEISWGERVYGVGGFGFTGSVAVAFARGGPFGCSPWG